MLKLKNKKVVVTGGTGTIGRVLVPRLRRQGCKVVVWSSQSDIRNKEKIDFAGVDYVVHLAAKLGGNKEEIYETNVGGTQNVLEKAIEARVKRLLYVSTIMVFADSGDQVRDERHKKRKGHQNWYADSKIKALEVVDQYQKKLPVVVVYPTVVVSKTRGWLRPGSLMSLVGSGRRVTNYIEVEKLADLMIKALVKGEKGEDYILGDRNIKARDYWWPGKLWRIPKWAVERLLGVRLSNMAFSSQKINSI